MPASDPPDFTPTAAIRELDTVRSKLVVLYLHHNGDATVDELKRELGMNLLTLFGNLQTLRTHGVVARQDDTWRCRG